MDFDVFIIGGGVAGMQCAYVLGSASKKPYAIDKKVGIVIHQKTSHLQNALFNNVFGLPPKTLGSDLLVAGKKQLSDLYPEIEHIENEKVLSIAEVNEGFKITTTKASYVSKNVVIALNYSKPFRIKGLESYLEPHQRTSPAKDRIQLKNTHYLIKNGLYCCGTIAGLRSQFSIAAGSGASVATDILTLWNNNQHTKVHDKI